MPKKLFLDSGQLVTSVTEFLLPGPLVVVVFAVFFRGGREAIQVPRRFVVTVFIGIHAAALGTRVIGQPLQPFFAAAAIHDQYK